MTADAVRRLLAVVDPVAHNDDGPHVPWSTLTELAELIGCDDATFQIMDARRRRTSLQSVIDGEREESPWEVPPDALFWSGFWECLACSYPQRTGDYQTVTRLSDVYARRDLQRITMAAFLAREGLRHEIMLPLPPDGVLDRRLLFFRRSGRDFSDDDVATLVLLRPHILALHLRQRRRNQGQPELTPRQQQILRMVAAGCTNHEIARALYLSEATVGKHLENIYARLNVTNRTAAAAAVSELDPPA